MNDPGFERKVEDKTDAPGALSRDALLQLAETSRDEKFVTVPGLGTVLVGEISGEARAQIQERQANSLQQERIDIRGYRKSMLVAGILDSSSPKEARQPLFKDADGDTLLKLGAGKVQILISAIEELSGMGFGAIARAEGNSETTPSDSSTSG